MMKRSTFGQKKWACLKTVSSKSIRLITSGLWVIQVLVVHVLKFSMITVNTFGVALQVLLKKTVTVSSKSGTSYLCNTTVMLTARWSHYLSNQLIQVWALSVSLQFCKVFTQTMKSTYSKT